MGVFLSVGGGYKERAVTDKHSEKQEKWGLGYATF